jgi:hypothetical protein
MPLLSVNDQSLLLTHFGSGSGTCATLCNELCFIASQFTSHSLTKQPEAQAYPEAISGTIDFGSHHLFLDLLKHQRCFVFEGGTSFCTDQDLEDFETRRQAPESRYSR